FEDLERPVEPAAEIGYQYFDTRGRRQFADPADAVDEVRSAAVAQVVAIDAGDHHVTQAQRRDGAREVERFLGVEGIGPAVSDVAERATAGALVAHDHEGRGALA